MSILTSKESYALEKFGVAADALATSAAPITDRLHTAFMSFHPVSAQDFTDPEDADAYTRIMDTLTTEEGAEGRVLETLKLMPDEVAEKVAQDIFDIYTKLARRR